LITASEGAVPGNLDTSIRNVIFAGKAPSWTPSCDVLAWKSGVPREPSYCFLIIRAGSSWGILRIRGLMVKQCSDGVQEHFKRIGSFEIWEGDGYEEYLEATGSVMGESHESFY